MRRDSQGALVGFNDYTALFDRPQFKGYVSGSYGQTDTDLSSYFPGCGAPCTDFFEIDKSSLWTGDLTGTYHNDRVSAKLEARGYSADGFRQNNQQEGAVYSGSVEGTVTGRGPLQLRAT